MSRVFLIPDTPAARRIATLGSVFIAVLAVRFALGLAKPDLSEAQAAIAGMTTVVLVAPSLHAWLGSGPLVPDSRRLSYRLLCACAVLSFLVFLGVS